MSTSFLISLVESKPLGVAALAGVGSSFVLGLGMQDALQFGAMAALGTSLGDTLLTIGGVGSKIESYMTSEPWKSYVDPNDFLAGAAGTAVMTWAVGFEGRGVAMSAALGAVSAGIAPKLAGYLLSMSNSGTNTAVGA